MVRLACTRCDRKGQYRLDIANLATIDDQTQYFCFSQACFAPPDCFHSIA